jgi:MFS superfamily sulfate permease-like transporter
METSAGEKQVKISLSEDVTFLNKGAIIRELAKIPSGTYLTIDMSKCYSIDYDVREAIEDFITNADDRNINVKMTQPIGKSASREAIYSKRLDKWIYALPVQNKPSKG